MDKQLNEMITSYIMTKWNDIFDLDEASISSSLNKIEKHLTLRTGWIDGFISCYPFFVPYMLLDDEFMNDMVNTVIDNKPHYPKNEKFLPYAYKLKPFDRFQSINFKEFDSEFWLDFFARYTQFFTESVSQSYEAIMSTMSELQHEFIQLVLNNIGTVLYYSAVSFDENIYFNHYVINKLGRYKATLMRHYRYVWLPKYDPEKYQEIEAAEEETWERNERLLKEMGVLC